MEHATDTLSGKKYFRLSGFARTVRVISTFVILGVGGISYFFPSYFPDVKNHLLLQAACVALFIWSNGVLLLMRIYQKLWIYQLNRIGWLAFFLLVIYETGGVNSGYVFVLVVPILTSALDLDLKTSKIVGIEVVVAYALMIFTDPANLHNSNIIFAHAVKTTIFGIIALFMHQIIKDTYHNKFEKEEANKKYFQLLEVDKLKSTFAMVVSHQLRTPLAGARFGMTTLLSSTQAASDLKALGPKILERIVTAIKILNDIFTTLEIGAEGLQKERKPFDLGTLVNEVIQELHDLAKSKAVTVSFLSRESLPVEGDRKILRIPFMNVIDNAIRYSPGGTVTVTLERAGDTALVTVRDTGIGISPDDQPHIFERFYRAKNALHLEPNESGIGLFISRRIIEHRLGTVELASSDERGTVMAITLPLAKSLTTS
ncbi:MAG: hypothetical protein A3B37_02215 [Candidatus Sungbacteria bacterium RIFCSPLOWO2_01_FULL_59_16]|uniref:histidine kinase n=1 Tax=Candidatus Sungbacteria bacterium RIFCSPLOWO2_01_FULL_59_16 TaxID=1802280 RepID=A0A1G2LCJ3_9BACT|nr:MAG: hypothetical protein A3B37_02215 [Candidatus Sungbacteria bacterium RIFCSPLOWO2_01_FULL_59_16]